MRSISFVAVTLLMLGCGSAGTAELLDDPNGAAGSNGGQTEWTGELAEPTQIATGEATLLGVTKDGWAVFRQMEQLVAAPITSDDAVKAVSTTPGSVVMRGNVLFNWANVDWKRGVGDLSVWSAAGGTHEVGETPYVEGLVAASASGATLVYPANTTKTTTDLMIASNDFSAPKVLIPAMGLGSEETCGAAIGFVGERLFVGWCSEGSRSASIQRFERVGGAWQAETIAEDALPAWSADESGERVFYQSSQYSAYVAGAGEAALIDASVGRGQMVNDGSAVFYTVGDQLRRSAVPAVKPTPIVTTGYKQPIGFSNDFELALYSTTVTYEEGTRRDLLLASTDAFNAEPIQLVSDPVAALGRSSMTQDGQYIFYLTDMSTTGATLHVVARDGSELLSLPGVMEVVAAKDSTLLFTDNPSDPDVYPVVADLKVINLTREPEARVVEESVLDGHNFQVSADGTKVVYARSGLDRDPEAADSKGLFAREIR